MPPFPFTLMRNVYRANGVDFEHRPFVLELPFPTGYKYANKRSTPKNIHLESGGTSWTFATSRRKNNTTQGANSNRLGEDTRIGTSIVAVRLAFQHSFRPAALRT